MRQHPFHFPAQLFIAFARSFQQCRTALRFTHLNFIEELFDLLPAFRIHFFPPIVTPVSNANSRRSFSTQFPHLRLCGSFQYAVPYNGSFSSQVLCWTSKQHTHSVIPTRRSSCGLTISPARVFQRL